MWSVAAATLPALITTAVFYGGQIWQQLAILLVSATISELVCLRWRRQALAAAFDGSSAVTACILAVALPPAAPWFVAAAAAAAAILLAKHCYGGLGNNPFNPAMVGYVLVFFAFPQFFSTWAVSGADAVSSPTPLGALRVGDSIDGNINTNAPLFIAAAAALGGLPLLLLRFADWRLTIAFLLGAALTCATISGTDGTATGGAPWRDMLYGGMVFSAFFVITDPVSAAASRGGRWLYGFAVGALALWLRQYGAHTDGIAFAILIGNLLAPLFDLAAGAADKRWRRG